MQAPFHDYDSLIGHMHTNADFGFDNCWAIDGGEREGKSVLAWQMANDIDPNFDPDKQVILDWEDWDENFSLEEGGKTYVFDEGGNLAFNRDYSKVENKYLVKILMQSGMLNNTLIFVIPNYWWLDRYLREHRLQGRIHVERQGYKRGFATAQWKQHNWRTSNVWMEDICDLRYRDIEKDEKWDRYMTKKRNAMLRQQEARSNKK